MALPIRQVSRLYRTGLCVPHIRSIGPSRSLCFSSRKQQDSSGNVEQGPNIQRSLPYSNNKHQKKPDKSTRAPRRISTKSAPIRKPHFEGLELNDLIDIKVDYETFKLAPITARDLCQCSACVDPSTRQKLFYTPDIPSDIRAKTVSSHPFGTSITWENDVPGYDSTHKTEISVEAMRKISRTGSPTHVEAPLPRSLWNAQEYDQETRDFEYESYMADDSVLYNAVKQLHTHGLLFVQNVPEDEESVVKLAERIGPLKTTFYGKTWDVRSVPDAKNVAYTAQNLGFHMDLMYMEQPPHLQLLHCIRSSSSGGASLFTDSFKAVDEIARNDEVLYLAMTKQKVPYHYDHEEHYYHQARPIIEERTIQAGSRELQGWTGIQGVRARHPKYLSHLSPIDLVDSVAWSPPFQAPFGVSSDFPPPAGVDPAAYVEVYNKSSVSWHQAAKVFNEMVHRPEAIYERLMKPGECVIFDNRRVLHARRAFDVGDVGKERWLKGAYIDKDPYVSKLKRLREKFEGMEEQVKQELDVVEQPSEVAAV